MGQWRVEERGDPETAFNRSGKNCSIFPMPNTSRVEAVGSKVILAWTI